MGIFVGLLAAVGCWWVFELARRKRHTVKPGYQEDIILEHKEEFELYHNSLSLCSIKTRVCLAELGIEYRSHHVDLIETGAYENIRPSFLRVNPAGTVPVLVHNGHPIYESHEQIRYLADHASQRSNSLFPQDSELQSSMQLCIDNTSLSNDPLNEMSLSAANTIPGLTFPLFSAMMRDVPYWRLIEGFLFHFDRRRPLLFFVLKLVGLQKFPRLRMIFTLFKKSILHLEGHLDELEKHLGETLGDWIIGDQYSLADVGWTAIFVRLEQLGLDGKLLQGRPACEAYWHALKRRKSYKLSVQNFSHPRVEKASKYLHQIELGLL